jgi:hypothetical protein
MELGGAAADRPRVPTGRPGDVRGQGFNFGVENPEGPVLAGWDQVTNNSAAHAAQPAVHAADDYSPGDDFIDIESGDGTESIKAGYNLKANQKK